MILRLCMIFVLLFCTQRNSLLKAALTPEDMNCDFENGFCKWFTPSWSQGNWTRTQNASPITGSGPHHAVLGDYYVYFDTIDINMAKDTKAFLVSPLIGPNPPSGSCLRFYYHMYGHSMGSLRFGLVFNSDHVADRVLEGNHGDKWYCDVVDLTYAKSDERIFFAAYRGSGAHSIIALDNFTLFTGVASCDECESLGNFTIPTTPSPTTSTTTIPVTTSTLPSESQSTNKTEQTGGNNPEQNNVIYIVLGVIIGILVVVVLALIVVFLLVRRSSSSSHLSAKRQKQLTENLESMSQKRRHYGQQNTKDYSSFPNQNKVKMFNDSQVNLTSKHSSLSLKESNPYDIPSENIYDDIKDDEEPDDGGYLHAKMSDPNLRRKYSEDGGYLHAGEVRDSINSNIKDFKFGLYDVEHNGQVVSESNDGGDGGYLHTSSDFEDGIDNEITDGENLEPDGYLRASNVQRDSTEERKSDSSDELTPDYQQED